MKFCYLHISDIYLTCSEKRGEQWAEESLNQDMTACSMLTAVNDLVRHGNIFDFIVITGDLVFQGKQEEYQVAEVFCRKLSEAANLPLQRLFIVPGNHDVNRSEIKQLHIKSWYSFTTQDDITEVLKDPDLFPIIMRKFTEFNAFAEKVTGRHSKYFFVEQLQIEKQDQVFQINLMGLNSCLFAGYDGDDNKKLALGLYQVDSAIKHLEESALFSIGFFHHPFICFHKTDKISQNILRQNLDLILTGHLHHYPSNAVITDPGMKPLVIGAGSSFETRESRNSFNIVDIDLNKGEGRVQFYKYLPYHNLWKKDTDVNPDREDGSFSFSIKSDASRKSSPAFEWPSQNLPNLQERNTYYITSVTLKNIQGFKSLSADFISEARDTIMFSLLLGDNNAGKTSFLRCLALGMCDEAGTIALMDNFRGKLIRHGQNKGIIQIELNVPEKGYYRINTFVERISDSESVKKECWFIPDNEKPVPIPPKDFPWNRLFVCGYGAGRVLGETRKGYEQYRVKDAVDTLFRYDQPMHDPELSLRRVVSAVRISTGDKEAEDVVLFRFLKLIKNLFMLTEGEYIELTGRGMEVVSTEGRFLLNAYGDGYKNTSGWVLDLIAWNMIAGRLPDPDMMTGIVLTDEIEQHLHPEWQRHIIQLLQEQFPKIQFIATTHSPLCTAGITDLAEDKYQILRFQSEPADLISVNSLRGLRADQILTSEAFGLPTTRNPDIAKKLEEFGKLYLKESRSEQEEQEFQKLGRLLDENLPESAEDNETRIMQEKLKNMLKHVEILTNTRQ